MPRAGLSPDIVVAEAGRLADEVGLDALTLAAVAERLGVRLPSLYKHIAGLDALRVHLSVAALREMTDELGAASVGRSGPDALLALAAAYRSFARRRPGLYAATVRAPAAADGEHVVAATALLTVVVAVLGGFHIAGDDAIDATRGLRALLHGFVAIEAAGGYQMPLDLDRSYRRLVTTFGDALLLWGADAAGTPSDAAIAPLAIHVGAPSGKVAP